MRIRSVKPAYWSDHDLHTKLNAAEREFYIGLWMQADDAGWLSWDVHRLGAELYGYRSTRGREAFINDTAAKLQTLDVMAPHLVIHDCGHAQVPKMPTHQHLSGKPVYSIHQAHMRCPATPRDYPRETAEARHGNGMESNGKESKGKVAREKDQDPVKSTAWAKLGEDLKAMAH